MEYPISHKTKFRDRSESELQSIVDAHQRVVRYFRDNFNLIVYTMHGTLLGLFREGDFISYDTDYDSAYMSKYEDPLSVKEEWGEISGRIKQDGLLIRANSVGNIKLWDPLKIYNFGVWTSWIQDDRYYCVRQYRGELSRSDVLPLAKKMFRGHKVHVPRDIEKMMLLTYGPKWRTPIDYYSEFYGTKGYCGLGAKKVEADGGLGIYSQYFRDLFGVK